MNKSKLKRIEKKLNSLNDGDFPRELREYELKGAYYSELPDRLKDLYCRYWKRDRADTDEFVAELFDLPVCHRLNAKELKEREVETQKIIAEIVDEYNSPENVAARRADLIARGVIKE